MSKPLRWLYPCFQPRVRPTSRAAATTYLRFYQAFRPYSAECAPEKPQAIEDHDSLKGTQTPEPRIRIRHGAPEQKYVPEPYPRISSQEGAVDIGTFREKYKDLRRGDSRLEEVIVRGMLRYSEQLS